jgi:hypothetical protein
MLIYIKNKHTYIYVIGMEKLVKELTAVGLREQLTTVGGSRVIFYIYYIHICNRDGETGEAANCCGGITCDFRHAFCDDDAVLVGKYAQC